MDTSRWVWNREIDVRLVHIKPTINFVLTDESGTREERRKPQEGDCSKCEQMFSFLISMLM